MANELAIADQRNVIDKHAEDIAELKRRARSASTPDDPAGCCTTYCCQEQYNEDLSIGEVLEVCEFVPDPIGGQGLRLEVSGWVRYSAQANAQMGIVVNVRLNGTMYTGHPRNILTMATNDELTIPYGLTVDSPVADPTLTVEVQNIGADVLRVIQAYGHLNVTPEDGSLSCGVAGSG